MKENLHPKYRDVVFMDMQTSDKFIIRSTVNTRDSIEIDGVTYPLFKCDTTSATHPFYTNEQTRVVEAGRVEKFRNRFRSMPGVGKSQPDAAPAA